MGHSGILFLILGAGRNLMRKNIEPFHGDNMPAFNREQHTEASLGLLKQANECNSTGQCHSLSVCTCLEPSARRCRLN